jgi:hypothetical protein
MATEPLGGLGTSREDAAELVKVLERHLKDARAIDTEALCIVSGERVRLPAPTRTRVVWSRSAA